MSYSTENIFDELRYRILGDVYTDRVRRYMQSTDGSIFKVEPACIVYPKNIEDIQHICRFADKYQLSIHPRGTGSGLCGAAIGRGIIVDFTKYMNKLLSFEQISEDEAVFTCEPGYKYGQLEAYLKGKGMWFPPSPSSGEYASFGGMYGTNAGGAYSVKYGNVADYIVDAEVVFYDGTVNTFSNIENTKVSELSDELQSLYELIDSHKDVIDSSYPNISCNVSGYNLRNCIHNGKLRLHNLFGGAEGTLGIITKLTFKVIRKKAFDGLVVAYFDNKTNCSRAAQMILKKDPTGIEIMDKSLLSLAITHEPTLEGRLPSNVDNILMFEFEGDTLEEVRKLAEESVSEIIDAGYSTQAFVAVSSEEIEQFWAVRKAAVPILYLLKGKKKILALVEDAAVSSSKLVEYFDGLYSIFERHNVQFVSYGHIAKGLLHNRPLLDLKDSYDIKLLKILADEVFDLVHSLGGTISGEHGDGRLRSCYIHRQYGPELYSLFLQVKSILDPNKTFNPEIKTIEDHNQMTKHLRYGADYSAVDSVHKKQLVWEEDFILEAEKCHGCSKCTTVTKATRMCPIYKELKDEAATPKAKANLLRGLLSGSLDNKVLYAENFQRVMDLCINCGSCYKECPSKVNIPKLALEAKSRYAEKFGVPMESRVVTGLEYAGRFGRKLSPISNTLGNNIIGRKVSQFFIGLSSNRELIPLSSKSLYEKVNKTEGDGRKTVLYFAGCYASYVKTYIGESLIRVLNHLDFKVITPAQFCCGIPHASKGLADQARKQINKNINKWGKLLDQVDYIVTTCSSCLLSLTKEWGYYMQNDIIEKIQKKTVLVTDLISPLINNDNFSSQLLTQEKLYYHTPCHLNISSTPNTSFNILNKIDGLSVEKLDNSCCGMAGSWGMLAKNYDLSIKIGEKMGNKLQEGSNALGVTDCPTCSIQMNHLSGKAILNPIEVIDKCIKK